jgi:hypothetical protein
MHPWAPAHRARSSLRAATHLPSAGQLHRPCASAFRAAPSRAAAPYASPTDEGELPILTGRPPAGRAHPRVPRSYPSGEHKPPDLRDRRPACTLDHTAAHPPGRSGPARRRLSCWCLSGRTPRRSTSYFMACHPRRGKFHLAAQAAMDESRSCPNLGSHPRWTQVHKQVFEGRYGIGRPMRWS